MRFSFVAALLLMGGCYVDGPVKDTADEHSGGVVHDVRSRTGRIDWNVINVNYIVETNEDSGYGDAGTSLIYPCEFITDCQFGACVVEHDEEICACDMLQCAVEDAGDTGSDSGADGLDAGAEDSGYVEDAGENEEHHHVCKSRGKKKGKGHKKNGHKHKGHCDHD